MTVIQPSYKSSYVKYRTSKLIGRVFRAQRNNLELLLLSVLTGAVLVAAI